MLIVIVIIIIIPVIIFKIIIVLIIVLIVLIIITYYFISIGWTDEFRSVRSLYERTPDTSSYVPDENSINLIPKKNVRQSQSDDGSGAVTLDLLLKSLEKLDIPQTQTSR